jgi:hypothetical protein
MMKTFWMSFTDPDRPEGQGFLGVVVLDVTAADADAARPFLPPTAHPGSEWLLAAQREAWRLGCNPGGEVKSWELPPDHPSAAAPRQVLLTRDDLVRLGLID